MQRDLTQLYVQLRARSAKKPDIKMAEISVPMTPEWIVSYNKAQQAIQSAKDNCTTFEGLSAKRKIEFDEEKELKMNQAALASLDRIRTSLKDAENNIKRIGFAESDGRITTEEQAARANAMRFCGAQLKPVAKTFKKLQENYSRELEEDRKFQALPVLVTRPALSTSAKRTTGSAKVSTPCAPSTLPSTAGSAVPLLQEVELVEQSSLAQRTRQDQILHLAQSVQELGQLFKDLNALVIEQGTVLDRIDYNIEQSKDTVAAAARELVQAEKISRKSYANKLIAALSLTVTVLAPVVIYKRTH